MTPPRVAHPLARRLPLAIGLLLSIVAGGVSWAAYIRVRRAVLDATAAQLSSAAPAIADMLQASLRRLPHELEPLANDPSVLAVLAASPAAATHPASQVLDRFRARLPQYGAVSVWDRKGDLLLTSGPRALAEAMKSSADRPTMRPSHVVGPLVMVHDTAAYGIFVAIRGPNEDTLGFLVGTRRFGDPGGAALIGKLVGKNARLVLGNDDGGVWTNLVGPADAPAAVARQRPAAVYSGPDGLPHMGSTTLLPGTPWIVWVDAQLGVPLATARRFLLDMVAIGLAFVFLGGIGSWLVVRRVIRPLQEVQQAAEELALGDLPKSVPIRADDEIGSLAKSFNTMAERIRRAGEELLSRAAVLEQRNRELHESELLYRQLVDQSPDAVVVHREGTVIFANSVAARLVGAGAPAHLLGISILDLVQIADRDEAKRRITTMHPSGGPSPLAELRLQKLNGGESIVEITGTPVLFDGAPAIQTLARDITERKLLEEQLRQSQKMEAVSRLAGGLAHDFNNLLTIISTYAELTLAGLNGDDPKRRDIEEIRRAAMSAAHLTRQMLAFSRKQVLAPRMIDVNDAITGLTGMLQRVIGDHVRVVTTLGPNLDPIWADARQLEQVVMNLAVNARDAMPTGGTLTIETAAVVFDDSHSTNHGRFIPAGEYILLAVSDSGTGMTEATKARIFEPFFTTKQPGKGTGLGLSTVYGIVKQSDGYIWVHSEPGRGSSFQLYFPRYTGAETGIPRLSGEHTIALPRDAEVLLVEDDTLVRTAILRILEKAGYSVSTAAAAPEAIEAFVARQGRIDLVITDMVMPTMTGAELVRELRERNPMLRAIIMSGYSEEVASGEWRLPPNTMFLEKPIAPNGLIRCIDEVLSLGD